MALDFDLVKEVVLMNVIDGFPTEAAVTYYDDEVEIVALSDYDELDAIHAWGREQAAQGRKQAVHFAGLFMGEESSLRRKALPY